MNDPKVVLLFEGFAIAAQHPAQQVTLINAQDESVTLYIDNDTHLPVKKTFTWRDPDDRQKNLEEEVEKQLPRGLRHHGTLQRDSLFQRRHGQPALPQLG